MDFVAAVVLFMISLVVSLLNGVTIVAPLIFGLLCFAATALRRGYSSAEVLRMALAGIKKTGGVILIFIMIGLLTAVWRACGTIPFLVRYGIEFIDPRFFVLCAFALTCVVSYALGTVFGTAGTVGVVLMALARSCGADLAATAGAIISGCFFGDRCAPTSSSANLVASVTGTRLYDNIRNMFRTALAPMALSLLIYLYFSLRSPAQSGGADIQLEIAAMFNLSPITALPALIIFILPLAGVGVKTAIALSVLAGAVVALWTQGMPYLALVRAMFFGYEPTGTGRFARLLAGGGVMSMVNLMGIILVSSSYAGIFDRAGLLNGAERFLERLSKRVSLYTATLATGTVTNMFVCNQSLSVILTNQLMGKIYERRGASNSLLAAHIEDTAILVTGLIPWSTAAAVPFAMLSADISAIPLAVFLWLVPIGRLLSLPFCEIRE
ncbi:sodium:proton antiporter [Synergistales bacterium]|nr:sodium:proton antiporter [Synergistales bacterium]